MQGAVLQREVADFSSAFEELRDGLLSAADTLGNYYEQALQSLQGGRHAFNTSIIKELKMYLNQINKIVAVAADGTQLFLLTLGSPPSPPPELSLPQLLDTYRDKTEIPLRHKQLTEKQLSQIRSTCTSLTSIQLISDPLDIKGMINDADLMRLSGFGKVTKLSLRGSNVSDVGIYDMLQMFPQLKEIDLSECRLVGSEGVRRLSGLSSYQFVTIKLNGAVGVSSRAILGLIATSYNLNYLEVRQLQGLNCPKLLNEVQDAYIGNRLNFKWLQLSCQSGTILFVNKLAYLTHLANADSITDREVAVLLAEQTLDGLYFNCCEDLHTDTLRLLAQKHRKLKRLGLLRFTHLTDPLLNDLVSALPRLQYLDLSQCFELTSQSLIHIANQLQGLKEVRISKCWNIEDEGVIYLAQKMPTLKAIDLAECTKITDQCIYRICDALPGLTGLNLQRCQNISADAAIYISLKLPKLQNLLLNYCERAGDEALCLIATRLRKMKRLQIQWCPISQKGLSLLAQNMSELEDLNLNYCPTVNDSIVQLLGRHASKLTKVHLATCQKVSSKSFIKFFQAQPYLKHLQLRQCQGVDDRAMQQLCSSSRGQLLYLDIGWCRITDKTLLSLSQFQQQILHLSLTGCSEVTDTGLGWIATTLTHLQYLNLTFCEKITDKGVVALSHSLQALRTLCLSDITGITDTAISGLTGLHNLEEVHLSGCVQVTSGSLIGLLHNLQKLQCLNISWCKKIFAQSLLLLVERMRNLRRFSVAALEVEDRLLRQVAQHLKRLQWINLQYCQKITDQGVLQFVERLPSLLKVDLQNSSVSEKTKCAIFEQLVSRNRHAALSP